MLEDLLQESKNREPGDFVFSWLGSCLSKLATKINKETIQTRFQEVSSWHVVRNAIIDLKVNSELPNMQLSQVMQSQGKLVFRDWLLVLLRGENTMSYRTCIVSFSSSIDSMSV